MRSFLLFVIVDRVQPAITCPDSQTLNLEANGALPVARWADAVASDNDPRRLPTVTQTQGPSSGSLFPVGDTRIEYTATDLSENRVSCEFFVTVQGM